ncbi:transcription factor IIIB 90 kDa subunit-like [Actinia tenebrosa]|uniref:B-related factor 1 n=1 Tax=Actinia tenebrosa TaxID=6105 RepID=A0A6P8IVS0_ACTTE|nr:transcription factor IIIB 90 kDa subunit-like [Actinia tenebrosa]
MSQVCSNCGGSDIDFDPSRGNAVCINCGSVLEDNIIVSEVQFQENSIGGTSAIGQFVSSEGNKAGIGIGSGFRHGLGQESRAVTLENGRKRINALGHQLQMNQHCIDTAFNFYKLAVNKRLTRGRRTSHVVAACLYLVCRTEKTPHMLLDFSDVLQIDVFTLGRAYLKIAQELYINLPAIDPCLYIHRFAHKLEFGEKEHDVAMTALRLVSRMKRDWIHHGRRPSGLCGAALLVAARFHNFSRTVKEVVRVVRISDTTIRKRLGEFKDTPSSQLTIDEFQKIDLEEEQDPPSFTHARKKAKQQAEDLNNPEFTNQIEKFQEEIDNMLGISKDNEINNIPDTNNGNKENLPSENTVVMEANEPIQNIPIVMKTTEQLAAEQQPQQPKIDYTPTFDEDGNEELDLTGLDDIELDACLLTNDEVEIKTKVWMEENKEYLEMIKEKEEREARDKEQGINKPEPKKKRKNKTKKNQPAAATAGEAIEKMLVEKKISRKINYEVLRDLETSQSTKPAEPAKPDEPVEPVTPTHSNDDGFLVPKVPPRSEGKKREAPKMLTTEAERPKKIKLSPSPSSQPKVPPKQAVEVRELVVESGPVEYAGVEQTVHEEVLDEEDEDYDEEDHVSAAQLLSQMYDNGPVDDYGDYGEEF